MSAKRKQIIEVTDYGNEEINRLAITEQAILAMEPEERSRAFKWFKSKYSKEWPSDAY